MWRRFVLDLYSLIRHSYTPLEILVSIVPLLRLHLETKFQPPVQFDCTPQCYEYVSLKLEALIAFHKVFITSFATRPMLARCR